MKLPFEWFIALRYLRARRKQAFISFISFISVAGVTLGVMALIVVISVMAGFENHLREKILGMSSHVIVKRLDGPVWDYDNLISELKKLTVAPSGFFSGFRYKLTGKGAHIEAATPVIILQGLVSSGQEVKGVVIRGVEPESVGSVMTLGHKTLGKGLEALGQSHTAIPPIILGKELAASLGATIGKTIQVVLPTGTVSPVGMLPKIRNFTVIGINTTGMYEYDNTMALIHLKDAQKLAGIQGGVQLVELKVSDIYASNQFVTDITRKLGHSYWAIDWQKLSRNLFSALKLEKLAMFIILTLIVVVAAFNIVSTLILMVMEKNQDIAILKTMGATNRQILKIFIYNGLTVGLVGTILGVTGGIAICEILARYKFIKIPAEVYYTDSIPILLNPADVVTIAASALIICFVATIYPARQAARVNASEALRQG